MRDTIRWSMPLDKNGRGDREPAPVWPDNWPIPIVGDTIHLANKKHLKVTAVDWFPHGEEEDDTEPFVYVVLREHRIGDR